MPVASIALRVSGRAGSCASSSSPPSPSATNGHDVVVGVGSGRHPLGVDDPVQRIELDEPPVRKPWPCRPPTRTGSRRQGGPRCGRPAWSSPRAEQLAAARASGSVGAIDGVGARRTAASPRWCGSSSVARGQAARAFHGSMVALVLGGVASRRSRRAVVVLERVEPRQAMRRAGEPAGPSRHGRVVPRRGGTMGPASVSTRGGARSPAARSGTAQQLVDRGLALGEAGEDQRAGSDPARADRVASRVGVEGHACI